MPQIQKRAGDSPEDLKEANRTPLIKVSRINSPNPCSDITPAAKYEEVALRSGLISVIEPSRYPTGWSYRGDKPDNYNDGYLSFRYPWIYWHADVHRPCLKIQVLGFGEMLIEGDFASLVDAINEGEKHE